MHYRLKTTHKKAKPSDQPPGYRVLLRPRVLAIAAPLLVTLLFGGVYVSGQQTNLTSVSRSTSVNQTPGISSPTAGASSSAATSTQVSNTVSSSATPNTPAQGSPGVSGPAVPTKVCDTVAETLAQTTYQTAVVAENARHAAQLTLIRSGKLLQPLVALGSQNAEQQEDALHTANLNQLAVTYHDQLAKSGCS